MYSQNNQQIQPSTSTPYKSLSKNSLFFIIFCILWQIAAIIIIGLFFGYDKTISQASATSNNQYLNIYLIMAFFIFMIAGLTLTSAYVTFSSSINMTFSILVSMFTLQNWFIYRCFWHKTGLPLDPMVGSFNGERYDQITFLPIGNFFRILSSDFVTASFYDAIGACIAMFCALTPLLGRIGFLEIFLLSWFGPFFYEINSSIFNKFFIVDTGFGMRGFLFGGMLGLWVTLILGKKAETKQENRFMSHYHINALALIGGVLVCLSYPSLVSTGLQYQSGLATTIAAVAQINMWLAIGGSIVGVFTANSIIHKKINVHDVIFVSLSGGIAFSSSSSINYNPGAAIAIGSGVGFISALFHTPLKRWMNDGGVLQSNCVISQFIIPGSFAVIMSSILQAVNQSRFNIAIENINQTYSNMDPLRTPSQQAGWQLMGFVFSLGSSILCAIILGVSFRCIRSHRPYWYFNDLRWIQFRLDKKRENQQ